MKLRFRSARWRIASRTDRQPLGGRSAQLSLVAVLSCLVVACGAPASPSSTSSSSSSDSAAAFPETSFTSLPKKDPAIARLFPKDTGTITVATAPNIPPATFQDKNGSITGFETDIVRAVAALSGRKITIAGVGFDGIIPGLQAGRYGMAFGTIGIHPDRVEILDMIAISKSGDAIVTETDSDLTITDYDDMCGLSVALLTGSTYVKYVTDASHNCTSDGKSAIDIQNYPQQANVDLALLNGRAELEVTDQVAALYQSNQHPGRLTIQSAINVNPNGLVLPKDSPLTKPMARAIQTLIDDGTYAQIMQYWHATDAGVDEALVNPST